MLAREESGGRVLDSNCGDLIMSERIAFATLKGILNSAAMEPHSIFHSDSSASFCITAGKAQKKRVLCAQNIYVEISLFKLKPALVLQTEI